MVGLCWGEGFTPTGLNLGSSACRLKLKSGKLGLKCELLTSKKLEYVAGACFVWIFR